MMTVEMAGAIVAGGERGATALTVLYDERCPLCRRLKVWLSEQAATVPFNFVAAGGAEARRRFPHLDHDRSTTVLTVITQNGAVYEGERAWLVCAWALPRWKPLAERMTGRARLRLVRAGVRLVDGYRHRAIARQGIVCEDGCPR